MKQDPALDDSNTPLQRVLMNPLIPDFRAFGQRFGVKVATGWGSTEIGFPISAVDMPNHKTCGKLSKLYEARIVDDAGVDVPIGTPGQILIRPSSPSLTMIEYLGNPDATAQAWRNGWFHTGDVMRRDADDYFYFVDRLSDYLRVRGNNVSSLEVESEISSHPEVAACAAVAVPSSIHALSSAEQPHSEKALSLDDDIKVFVVRRPDSRLTHLQLMQYLMPRMPRFMLPRYIEFVADMPLTPTGKVQKKALREQVPSAAAWDRVDAGVVVPR